MSDSYKAVDNVERKKWDLDEYKRKADEKLMEDQIKADERERGAVIKRQPLKRREWEVDLASHIGNRKVISMNTELSSRGGFFCKTCECLLKDSQTYLDHINGKKHQKALGMSMKVERATVSDVRKRLQHHKRKLEESKHDEVAERLEDFEERLKLQARRNKKKKRKTDKDSRNGGSEHVDKSTSSSSAKEATVAKEEEEGAKKEAKDEGAKKEGTKKEEEAPVEEDSEAAMMAAMGFGGFGGSKKNT